jgi:hypothetical protein
MVLAYYGTDVSAGDAERDDQSDRAGRRGSRR